MNSRTCALLLFVVVSLTSAMIQQPEIINSNLEKKIEYKKIDGTEMLWKQQHNFLKTNSISDTNFALEDSIEFYKINVIFSVLNGPNLDEYVLVPSTLQGQGSHCCVYVADDEWRGIGSDDTGITNQDVMQIIECFDNNIYPIETEVFSELPDFGFGDRVTILLTDIEDNYPSSSEWIGGYFYYNNYLPQEQFPESNECHMLVIDTNPTIINNPNNEFKKTLEEGLATIAHEYQHLLHFWSDPYETTWVNEGQSDFAEFITLGSIPVSHLTYFLAFHSVNLEEWDSGDVHTVENYGASFLYMQYLYENFGGSSIISDIHNDEFQGRDSISKYLIQHGTNFKDVFTDWSLANLLDNPSLRGESSSALGYYNIDIPSDNTNNISVINYLWHGLNWDYGPFPFQEEYEGMDGVYPTPDQGYWKDTQHQLDANYFRYLASETPSALNFEFLGNGTSNGSAYLVIPRKGQLAWYSGRDNHLNSGKKHILSQSFDFSKLSSPCMKIDTWFDIEHGYDFGYVEISDDGGTTWSNLDDVGGVMTKYLAPNSIGREAFAFSGQSGSWKHDVTFDLSDYAGQNSVVIRFVYSTDHMVLGEGWVVDNIRFLDGDNVYCSGSDTSDSSWYASGWEHSDTSYNLDWTVYLVGYPYDGAPAQKDIYKMSLDPETQDGTISLSGLGSKYHQIVIVPSLIINNNNNREFEYFHRGWVESYENRVPNTYPLYNTIQSKINVAILNLQNSLYKNNKNIEPEIERNLDKINELVNTASFGANYVFRATQLNKAFSILSDLLSQL